MKHSPSEPLLRSAENEKNRSSYTSVNTLAKPAPLHPLPRSPERPLAQCQVKPMLKIPLSGDPFRNNSHHVETDDSECGKLPDDFVPISLDKPSGLAIDDFLPVREYWFLFEFI